MPMPMEYAYASRDFDAFIEALRQKLDHVTRHQTYQTVESVLRVFRRRLTLHEAVTFADALPPVLRAIFVARWNPDEPRRSFDTLVRMNREVQEYRVDHDFSPDTAIEDMAAVLWRFVDAGAFRQALSRLPPDAAAFWSRRDG